MSLNLGLIASSYFRTDRFFMNVLHIENSLKEIIRVSVTFFNLPWFWDSQSLLLSGSNGIILGLWLTHLTYWSYGRQLVLDYVFQSFVTSIPHDLFGLPQSFRIYLRLRKMKDFKNFDVMQGCINQSLFILCWFLDP